MPYDPFKHHRRSIRLRDYDYSQAGAYFVTICTQNRENLFGEIGGGGEMHLNAAGAMIMRWWDELSNKYPTFESDAFVVMPNHIHGIVNIGQPHSIGQSRNTGQPHRAAPTTDGPTLGDIVDWFKAMATNEYIRGVKQLGWKPFDKRIFQRNYYEHIIRSEREWNTICEYIQNNPANWVADLDNPNNTLRRPLPKTIADYLWEIGIA